MPNLDAQKHHRRSIRLKGYDYSQPGAYFVTLVTWQRECLFGEVVSGQLRLNPFGRLIHNEWQRLGDRFSRVVLDEWIVMPNHLHGILMVVENDMDNVDVGARQKSSSETGESSLASPLQAVSHTGPGVASGSLGAIIGAYKSTTTRLINGLRRTPASPVWQRNYYEHIIRNEDELEAIRAYI
jgi:putative transposase